MLPADREVFEWGYEGLRHSTLTRLMALEAEEVTRGLLYLKLDAAKTGATETRAPPTSYHCTVCIVTTVIIIIITK